VVLSVLFYLRSKRERKPRYRKRTFVLLKKGAPAIPGLSISFHGAPVDEIYVTRIAVLNEGREPIRASDNAAQDPLRIEADGDSNILAAEIEHQENVVNNFRIMPSGPFPSRKVLIAFDFFERWEGIVLTIYHTGTVACCGTIVGGGRCRRATDEPLSDAFGSRVERFLEPAERWVRSRSQPFRFVLTVVGLSAMLVLMLPIMLPLMAINLDQQAVSLPAAMVPRRWRWSGRGGVRG
jgi:hypothetical protein